MPSRSLPERERLLSIWAKNRLGERETVEWALAALKEIRGELGTDTAALLEFLDRQANANPNLPERVKTVWRLLKIAAVEKSGLRDDAWLLIHEIKERISSHRARFEDIDQLCEYFRPRLAATELLKWGPRETEGSPDDDPLRWVQWEFKTAIQSSYQPSIQLQQHLFPLLDTSLLERFIDGATAGLRNALAYAAEIEWLGNDRDLPNHLVHRVYIPPEENVGSTNESAAEKEDRDPDAYNNDFAPIIRMLSNASFALLDKEAALIAPFVGIWRTQQSGLFLRLAAVVHWSANFATGEQSATFLQSINENAFWRWMVFPEIASLRGLRWDDLPANAKSAFEAKLLNGPTAAAFAVSDVPDETITFHRDHELARLVDNNRSVPPQFIEIVQARRESDPTFPPRVALIEPGLEGTRVSWVPPGDAEKFAAVGEEELLATLAADLGTHAFDHGNDAEAFGKTAVGKRRLLDSLRQIPPEHEHALVAWKLLLSYPIDKNEADRDTAEGIASLAIEMPPTLVADLFDQLCYWLDATDAAIPEFRNSDQLWLLLLPHAAVAANKKQSGQEEDEKEEIDLTMAALNEPLGHLLSMFLRRCPSMPASKEERPPLPQQFVLPLKELHGRAKELLANRIAVATPYFARADRPWVDELVLSPMTTETPSSDRLWEAFARYSKIPPDDVWGIIQDSTFKRLRSSSLSPEAKRRLAEIAVVIWVWSKQGSPYSINATGLRAALGLSNDDVRAAAAWQFSSLFFAKPDKDKNDEDEGAPLWSIVGHKFFEEVWPLEPTLQSPASANDFAKIPASVGFHLFSDALHTVLPFLMPFEVWAVFAEFRLDAREETGQAIIKAFPEDTLILLAVCIDEKQQHGVFDLKAVIDLLLESKPDLESDYRIRQLRRLASPAAT